MSVEVHRNAHRWCRARQVHQAVASISGRRRPDRRPRVPTERIDGARCPEGPAHTDSCAKGHRRTGDPVGG